MPYGGVLFTSQAPFFCVFLVSLVAYRMENRAIVTDWFDTVLSAASCRSVSLTTIVLYMLLLL
jgi:hypothetical protein